MAGEGPGYHDGCMIALRLQPEDAARVATPEGLSPDDMHVTLAYLGTVDEISPDQRQAVAEAVAQTVAETPAPLEGQFPTGFGTFTTPPDEDTPYWAQPEIPDLDDFRTRLVQALQDRGVSGLVHTDHPFSPHVTISYLGPGEDQPPTPDVAPAPISFKDVSLEFGPDKTRVPFPSSNPDTSELAALPPVPLFAEVAATLPVRPPTLPVRRRAPAIPLGAERVLERMTREHNSRVAASERVRLPVVRAVYARGVGSFSLAEHPGMTRDGYAFQRVSQFLSTLANGVRDSRYVAELQDLDLLPRRQELALRRPSLLAATRALTAAGASELVLTLRAVASLAPVDPRRRFTLSRVTAAARADGVTTAFALPHLEALLADGNSRAARSLRAKRQLRDRYGRWIEMGGGIRFKIRDPGSPGGGGRWYHGTAVGIDQPNGLVQVQLMPEDGGQTVSVPANKVEKTKATLPGQAPVASLPDDTAAPEIDSADMKDLAPDQVTPGEANPQDLTPADEDTTDEVKAAVAQLRSAIPDDSTSANQRDALIARLNDLGDDVFNGRDPDQVAADLHELADNVDALEQANSDLSPDEHQGLQDFAQDVHDIANLTAPPSAAAVNGVDVKEQAQYLRNDALDLHSLLPDIADPEAKDEVTKLRNLTNSLAKNLDSGDWTPTEVADALAELSNRFDLLFSEHDVGDQEDALADVQANIDGTVLNLRNPQAKATLPATPEPAPESAPPEEEEPFAQERVRFGDLQSDVENGLVDPDEVQSAVQDLLGNLPPEGEDAQADNLAEEIRQWVDQLNQPSSTVSAATDTLAGDLIQLAADKLGPLQSELNDLATVSYHVGDLLDKGEITPDEAHSILNTVQEQLVNLDDENPDDFADNELLPAFQAIQTIVDDLPTPTSDASVPDGWEQTGQIDGDSPVQQFMSDDGYRVDATVAPYALADPDGIPIPTGAPIYALRTPDGYALGNYRSFQDADDGHKSLLAAQADQEVANQAQQANVAEVTAQEQVARQTRLDNNLDNADRPLPEGWTAQDVEGDLIARGPDDYAAFTDPDGGISLVRQQPDGYFPLGFYDSWAEVNDHIAGAPAPAPTAPEPEAPRTQEQLIDDLIEITDVDAPTEEEFNDWPQPLQDAWDDLSGAIDTLDADTPPDGVAEVRGFAETFRDAAANVVADPEETDYWHDKEIMAKELVDNLDELLQSFAPETPETPEPAAAPKPGDPTFTILSPTDRGQDGDGYHPSGPWGKYGASGVMIHAQDEQGTDRFLIVQRGFGLSSNKGKWQFPGGARDENESAQQAAARELAEEINGGADAVPGLSQVGEHVYDNGQGWNYTTSLATLPTMFEASPFPGNEWETNDARWVTADELRQMSQNGDMIPALNAGKVEPLLSQFGPTSSPTPDAVPESAVSDTGTEDLSAGAYDVSNWTKIGGQGGSNPGGTYQAPDGTRYYVKTPKSPAHAHNEVLASALYAELGVPSAYVRLSTDGQIVSKMVPDAQADFQTHLNDPEYMAKIQDGFAVDAWLANWDVAGLVFDNVVSDANGNPVRVDGGGALIFRAQGAPKGGLFGNEAGEIDTLRTSPQGKKVFGAMTEDAIRESAKKLLDVSESRIDEIVDSTGFDLANKELLRERLKARRSDILTRFDLVNSQSALESMVPEAIQTLDTQLNAPELKPENADKVRLAANGVTQLEIGMKVTSIKDGSTGTVVKYDPSDKYVKVKMDATGKTQAKATKFLQVSDENQPQSQPQSAPVQPPTPEPTPALVPAPSLGQVVTSTDELDALPPGSNVEFDWPDGYVNVATKDEDGTWTFDDQPDNTVTSEELTPGEQGETATVTQFGAAPGFATEGSLNVDELDALPSDSEVVATTLNGDQVNFVKTDEGYWYGGSDTWTSDDLVQEHASIVPAEAETATVTGLQQGQPLPFSLGGTNVLYGEELYYEDTAHHWQKVKVTGISESDPNDPWGGGGGLQIETEDGQTHVTFSASRLMHANTAEHLKIGYPAGTKLPVTYAEGGDVRIGDEVSVLSPQSGEVQGVYNVHGVLPVPEGSAIDLVVLKDASGDATVVPAYALEKGDLSAEPPIGPIANPISFGATYPALPDGAVPHFEMNHYSGMRYVVQHPDGKLYVYGANGFFEPGLGTHGLNSYVNSQFWKPYTGPTATATAPGATTNLPEIGESLPDAATVNGLPVGSTVTMLGVFDEETTLTKRSDGDWEAESGFEIYPANDVQNRMDSGFGFVLDSLPEGAEAPAAPTSIAGTKITDDADLNALPQGTKIAWSGAGGQKRNLTKDAIGWKQDGTAGFYMTNDNLLENPDNSSVTITSAPDGAVLPSGTAQPPVTSTPVGQQPLPGAPTVMGGDGNALWVGAKVVASKDGKIGIVTGIEANGNYLKVKFEDGKTQPRHRGKLKLHDAAPNSVGSVSNGNASATPASTGVSTTYTGQTGIVKVPPADANNMLVKGEPDPESPWYQQPAPEGPAPLVSADTKFVSDEWMDQADANYRARMKSKNPSWVEKPLSSSSTYSDYVGVQYGNETALNNLFSAGRITDEMHADAKNQIAANQAEIADRVNAYDAAVKKWTQDRAAWAKANGQSGLMLKGMRAPGLLSMNDTDAVDWMWANQKPGTLGPNGAFSPGALRAVKKQKSSSDWQKPLRAMGPASLDPKNVTAQTKALDKAMLESPPLTSDIMMIRTLSTDAFVNPQTGERFKHHEQGTNANTQFNLIVGTVQHDWGFPEMSPGDPAAGATPGYPQGNVTMHVRLPKGTRGVWTGGDKQGYGGISSLANERGFIAERGLVYYVHRVWWANPSGGSGRWHVEIEVIPKDTDYSQFGHFTGPNFDFSQVIADTGVPPTSTVTPPPVAGSPTVAPPFSPGNEEAPTAGAPVGAGV